MCVIKAAAKPQKSISSGRARKRQTDGSPHGHGLPTPSCTGIVFPSSHPFRPGKKGACSLHRNAPVRACRRKLASGFQRINAAQLLNITTEYQVETETEKPMLILL